MIKCRLWITSRVIWLYSVMAWCTEFDATGNFVKVWSLTKFSWREILRTLLHFRTVATKLLWDLS